MPPPPPRTAGLGGRRTRTAMKHPIIIEGRPFDWEQAQEDVKRRLDPETGEMTFAAAMVADPGVLSCPFCDEMMWHEGRVVACPTCGQRFSTNWREVARKATGRDPVVRRLDNQRNADIVAMLHGVYDRAEAGEPFALPHDAPPIVRRLATEAQASVRDAHTAVLRGMYDEARTRMGSDLPASADEAAVEALCERVGYGACMAQASRPRPRKHGGGAFVVGTCYDLLAVALGEEPIGPNT